MPEGDTVGDYIVALDAQTGRLDIANDRISSMFTISERCEERDRKALEKSRRKVLGVF